MADKKVTARDLKTFIEAVEFAADSDTWVPSERQWKKIRSMIDQLEEVVAPPPQPVRMAAPAMTLPVEMPQQAMQPPRMAPGGLGGGFAGGAGPQGGLTAFGMGQSGALKVPDIDTSNGQYNTPFV